MLKTALCCFPFIHFIIYVKNQNTVAESNILIINNSNCTYTVYKLYYCNLILYSDFVF